MGKNIDKYFSVFITLRVSIYPDETISLSLSVVILNLRQIMNFPLI